MSDSKDVSKVNLPPLKGHAGRTMPAAACNYQGVASQTTGAAVITMRKHGLVMIETITLEAVARSCGAARDVGLCETTSSPILTRTSG